MDAFVINLLLQYRYFLIVPLAVVEGPLIMLAGGFFVRMDVFALVPMFFALLVGDLVGDVLWYAIGYHWGRPFIRRFGKYVSITEDKINSVEHIFHKYHERILFISKITMGFGFALVTLITAGLMKIPFRKYLMFNVLGGFIWTAALMTAGYYLGELFLKASKGLEYVTLGAGIVILLALGYGFSKFVKSKFQNVS